MFGLVAAGEAVVIVALLVTREPPLRTESRSSESADRGVTDAQTVEAPTFAFEVGAGSPTGEPPPSLPATVSGPPEALVAPATAGGVVGIVICGSVAAADGGPIADEDVVLEFSDREGSVVPVRGAWSAAGFAAGAVSVTCRAVDFLSQTVELELDASRAVERHNFRLETAPSIPIAFRTPDGQPLLPQLEAAMVPGRLRAVATLEAPGAELTDGMAWVGAWLLFGEDATSHMEGHDGDLAARGWTGLIKASRQPPFIVSAVWGRRVLASETVTSVDAQITFTFALETFFAGLASVRARVVDQHDGKPLGGFLAQLDDKLVDVGDDGTVHIARVSPGKNKLKLFPPGGWQHIAGGSTYMSGPGAGDYEQLELPVECRPGQELDLGDIAVRRTVTVRGRVTNTAGERIVTSVSVHAADVPARVGEAGLYPQIDERGGFVVRVVPGRWSFSAGPDSIAPPRVLDVLDDVDDLVLIGVGAPVGN